MSNKRYFKCILKSFHYDELNPNWQKTTTVGLLSKANERCAVLKLLWMVRVNASPDGVSSPPASLFDWLFDASNIEENNYRTCLQDRRTTYLIVLLVYTGKRLAFLLRRNCSQDPWGTFRTNGANIADYLNPKIHQTGLYKSNRDKREYQNGLEQKSLFREKKIGSSDWKKGLKKDD